MSALQRQSFLAEPSPSSFEEGEDSQLPALAETADSSGSKANSGSAAELTVIGHTASANEPVTQKIRHPWWALALKRVFDLCFVVIFLGLFWWVYPLVALAIWVSSQGPLVYGHTRVGRGGRKFKCYKFRSMVVNSKEVLDELLARDPVARSEWERSFKLKDDPRITAVGAFLRKTSLDELPQLWNIITGDMSVVGPRPVTRTEIKLHYADGDSLRHYISLRPGLTGPWQVGGRSDTTYEERVAIDSDYVRNWNVWSDFKIVMATVAVIFTKRGAY
jgi:exopolysaccharide production protein ExoY